LKLDQFQDILDKQHEKIENVEAQHHQLMQKVGACNLDFQQTLTSLHGLETRVAKNEQGEIEVKACMDSCVHKMEACIHDSSRVAEQVTVHGGEIEAHASMIDLMRTSTTSKFIDAAGEREKMLEKQRQDVEGLFARIQMLDKEVSATRGLQTQVLACDRKMDAATEQLEVLAKKSATQDDRMKDHSRRITAAESQLCTSEKERLAELQVVCNQLQIHEGLLRDIPPELRDHIRTEKAGTLEVVACMQAEISEILKNQVSFSDLHAVRHEAHCSHAAITTQVKDAHHSHTIMVESLESSVQQLAATSSQQDAGIGKQQAWMNEVSLWMDRAHDRAQCLTEALLHVVEEDHPDMMVLLERRLQEVNRPSK